MTFSNNLRMQHLKTSTGVFGCLVAALLLAACTPTSPSPSGGSSAPAGQAGVSSQAPAVTPSATSTEQVGKDGRTVDPSAAAGSCSLLPEADIRDVLGTWAATLQPGQ